MFVTYKNTKYFRLMKNIKELLCLFILKIAYLPNSLSWSKVDSLDLNQLADCILYAEPCSFGSIGYFSFKVFFERFLQLQRFKLFF